INDLTVGHPLKLIIQFAIPLLLGNLFMQLYQVSDMMIVGHLISINALAAIGASTPIYMVFLMIAFGFTGGLTVITAQRFGARDEDGVRQSVFHCTLAAIILSVILTAVLLIFLTSILKLMNMPSEIFEQAYDFMYVIAWSTSLIILYNLMAGFIRALGDSKTPLYFLIFSSLINIVLNFIFINYCKLGVIGSALGTLCSNFIALVVCLTYMWKKFPLLRLKKEFMHYNSFVMKEHLKLAFPMALQFSILSFGIMIVQSVCNSFGADIIAAFAAAFRIEQFVTQPLLAIGLSMATFSAQNWGANLLSRIRRGVRYAFILTVLISIAGFLIMRQFGQDMIAWFIDTGDTSTGNNTAFILEIGKQYLVISTMFYVFLGAIFVFRNTIQGMGKPLIPLLSSITELLTRTYAAICLAKAIGYKGIMYASPISWVAAGILVIIGYNYYVHIFKSQTFRWKIGEVKQSLRENGPVD
ncbi:MAG: MATE family efflux transporter, partial [Alphaproteobacteria bacterium]|nr:MATE family efflux transporter [Alphaproteobacteria bacterium]